MGIYSPQPFLSADDIELIGLLGALLLEYDSCGSNTNRPPLLVPLSPQEAYRLLELLESFASSRKFLEGSYFVERISSGVDVYDKKLWEIYHSWRKRQGRSRAMATVHWRRFINRLGIVKEPSGYLTGGYVIDAAKMELAYFLRMESRLLSATGVHPRVRQLLLQFIETRLSTIEATRTGKSPLRMGAVREPIELLIRRIKSGNRSTVGEEPLSVSQLSSTMLIVADISVLFTTRDWDVCGTLSAIAGATPYALGYSETGA